MLEECGERWRGPGPVERKWYKRLRFRLTGRWSPRVVEERLYRYDRGLEEMYEYVRGRMGCG